MGRTPVFATVLLLVSSCVDPVSSDPGKAEPDEEGPVRAEDYIQPYPLNPSYWQYKGEPVVLIGGSDHTPLFNFRGPTSHLATSTERGDRGPETVAEHLERLSAQGGNYVRNTMSWYMPDEGQVAPFRKNGDGLFDLTEENPEFWSRFEDFLSEAYARDIIVHIELFDPFNYYRENEWEKGWSVNPFNPELNVNYTAFSTGLPASVMERTRQYAHPIFQTAPGMAYYGDGTVISYLEAFVDRMLDTSLQYPNILYTIYNEGHEAYQPKQFADHWSAFIRERGKERGVPVFVGLMPFERDPTHATYRAVYDDPMNYQFIDISQNNRLHSEGEEQHWEHIMQARRHVSAHPRPFTSVKIYGFGTRDASSKDFNSRHSWTGDTKDAVDRHLRNLIGGVSSSRFHRCCAGLGLSVDGEYVLRSSRMFLSAIDLISCEADADFSLFFSRQENQAYACFTGTDYAVYAAGSGSFGMRLSAGVYEVRWIDVMNAEWAGAQTLTSSGPSSPVTLNPPGPVHAGVIRRQ